MRLEDIVKKAVDKGIWPGLGKMFNIPVPGKDEGFTSIIIKEGETLEERIKKVWQNRLSDPGLATHTTWNNSLSANSY